MAQSDGKCIIVTRDGWGDVWEWTGKPADCPLLQPGDAVLCEPWDVLRNYNTLEIIRFTRAYCSSSMLESVARALEGTQGERDTLRRRALEPLLPDMWDQLLQSAKPVPSDASELSRVVRQDTKEKEKTMAEAAKKEAEKAPKKTRNTFDDKDTIVMGVDKDGKKYGKDNNPKRAGTKAEARFAKFRDGMTVGEFVKAVGSYATAKADIDWGIKKGQLSIKKAA